MNTYLCMHMLVHLLLYIRNYYLWSRKIPWRKSLVEMQSAIGHGESKPDWYTYNTTLHLHIRLWIVMEEEAEFVRDKETSNLLGDCVFCMWQRSDTSKISVILLPTQVLNNDSTSWNVKLDRKKLHELHTRQRPTGYECINDW